MASLDPAASEAVTLARAYDPHYARILERLLADIAGFADLPARTVRLASIGTACGLRSHDQLRTFLESAGDSGLRPEEALEPIFLCTSYAGFAPLLEGLRIFASIYTPEEVSGQKPEDYPPGPAIEGYDGPALEVGIEMYGPVRARSNIQMFRALDAKLSDALEAYAYAGLFRRRVLPAVEREVASIGILAFMHRPGPLAWHAKAALRLGASPATLKQIVLSQIAVGGVVEAFAAMAILNPILADWRAHPGSDGV